MDNIQKLVLGVLGFAGMLVMLVPSQIDIAPQQPPAVASNAAAEAPPVTAESDGIAKDAQEQAVKKSIFSDEDISVTGVPAIDGNPIQGSPNNVPQDQPEQSSAPPVYDYSQPITMPGIAYPQYGQQPSESPDQQQSPAT